MRRLRLLAAASALVVAAAAAALGLHYYRIYRDVQDARALMERSAALLEERGLDADAEDLDRAALDLDRAASTFGSAHRRISRDPLLALAARLPWLGPQARSLDDLAQAGSEGARAGLAGVEAGRAYRQVRDGSGSSLSEQVAAVLDGVRPPMGDVRDSLQRIDARRERLDGRDLWPPLASARRVLDEKVDQLHELVKTYEETDAFFPEFLGFNGSRTYLVLAQNNAELLPTGGLVSVFGTATFSRGKLQSLNLEDAISFGERMAATGRYVAPPRPIDTYLLHGWSWNLSVSNWSPDFPTSARQAEVFYAESGGPPVDGVIAINLDTLRTLLRVTGPVDVPEYGVTVTADNAMDIIEANTRTPLEPGGDRKAFVAYLADRVIRRLFETGPEHWSDLVNAAEQLRDRREVLFYSHDPALQEVAARMGIDGGLEPAAGSDYLMVVDASLHSTKLNAALDQSADLFVELDNLGRANHHLSLNYGNKLSEWERGRDPRLVSRLMLSGVYGDYLRVLAPPGSALAGMAVDGIAAAPEDVGKEGNKVAFARFFSLARDERRQLEFAYRSPGVIERDGAARTYRLHVQKQPGAIDIPLHIAVTMPEGARPRDATLDGRRVDINDITTDLSLDRELVVRYDLDD